MNKKIVVLLVLLFSLGLFGENHWRQVSGALSDERTWGSTLLFDSNGEMFVGFREQTFVENTNGPYYTSVKQYNTTKKIWEYVGNSKFSPKLADWGCISFAIDSENELYFSFLSRENDSSQTVMTYDGNSELWRSLSDNLPEGSRCATLSSDNNGQMYVVLLKRAEITVMKYNSQILQWELVGTQGFANSASNEFPMSLVFNEDNTPFIAFASNENENESYDLTVMGYNKELNLWETVGKSGFAKFQPPFSMKVAGENNLFVVFSAEGYTGVQVMQYDKTLLAWTVLPGSDFQENDLLPFLSNDTTSTLSLSLLSGVTKKTKTMKYNFSTLTWEMVGNEIDAICDAPVFNSSDTPFLSCTDSDGILTVLTFDDQPDDPDTSDTGNTADSANTSADTDNTTDSGDSADDTSDSGGGNACAVVVIW